MINKYIKLTNKVIMLLVLLGSVLGCSDFLEQDEELQYLREDEVLTSGQRSRGLIDDLYRYYSFNYFNDFSIEYLTDNAVLSSQQSNLGTGYWGPTSNPYEYVWEQSYNNLRQIFLYIDRVHDAGLPYLPAASTASLNEIIIDRYYGEAHFLKAWSEWELLKIFGGLSEDGEMLGFPIVNEILENEEYATLSRNTYEECVDQIMKDLDVAISFLPLIYEGSGDANEGLSEIETGRASGLAAYALKAKVALFAASPAFNPTNDLSKWELAATYAQDLIMQNGGLKALQGYDFRREDNPDQIWRLRNTRQNNSLENRLYPPSLFGQGEVNPSQNLVDAFPAANGYPISAIESTYDDTTPYASRDSRFYRFIFYNNDQCFESATCTDFDPLQIYEGGLDNFGGFNQDEGTRTGYYLKKYLNNLNFDPSVIGVARSAFKVYVQLDLADMYLSYAEALNEAFGQPDATPAGFNFSAKEVLSMVRRRAGLTTDPYLDLVSANSADFRNLVKNERRIELCFTGERFHDLRRWKEIDTIEDIDGMKITKNSDDTFSYQRIDVEERNHEAKNYYLPLPYGEILINTNLKQNQGW